MRRMLAIATVFGVAVAVAVVATLGSHWVVVLSGDMPPAGKACTYEIDYDSEAGRAGTGTEHVKWVGPWPTRVCDYPGGEYLGPIDLGDVVPFFIGCAAFFVSCVVGVGLLIVRRAREREMHEREMHERDGHGPEPVSRR